MRIRCPHCLTLGVVSNCKENGAEKTAYLNCSNPTCNARTAHKISYTHDIRPPESQMLNMFEEMLAKMDPERRDELLKGYRDPV